MPILLLFTTHLLRGKPAHVEEAKNVITVEIENQIQEIRNDLAEQKDKIATIEAALRNILNGRF